jgi:hypothetical protein
MSFTSKGYIPMTHFPRTCDLFFWKSPWSYPFVLVPFTDTESVRDTRLETLQETHDFQTVYRMPPGVGKAGPDKGATTENMYMTVGVKKD